MADQDRERALSELQRRNDRPVPPAVQEVEVASESGQTTEAPQTERPLLNAGDAAAPAASDAAAPGPQEAGEGGAMGQGDQAAAAGPAPGGG